MTYDSTEQFDGYTISRRVLPKADPRLGRTIVHDSRNRGFAITEADAATLVTVVHDRLSPVLDQGQVGSCTGNATVGNLGTMPVKPTVPAGTVLDENLALKVYSAAEVIDGDGPYPPNDNGSSGPSVAKAARNLGLCSSYTHAFSLLAAQTALQTGPVMFGTEWTQDMFTPDADGYVHPTGAVAGGHEYEVIGVDFENKRFVCVNSWGTAWGIAAFGLPGGVFYLSFADAGTLLAAEGDVTQLVPLAVPAPTPVPPTPTPAPVPPTPTPTPTPAPSGGGASFPGSSPQVDAHLAARAARKGLSGAPAYEAWFWNRVLHLADGEADLDAFVDIDADPSLTVHVSEADINAVADRVEAVLRGRGVDLSQ